MSFEKEVSKLGPLEMEQLIGKENGLKSFEAVWHLIGGGAQIVKQDGKTMMIFSAEQAQTLNKAEEDLKRGGRCNRNAKEFLDGDYELATKYHANFFVEWKAEKSDILKYLCDLLGEKNIDEETVKRIYKEIQENKETLLNKIEQSIYPIYELSQVELTKLVDFYIKDKPKTAVRVKKHNGFNEIKFEWMYVGTPNPEKPDLLRVFAEDASDWDAEYISKREIAFNNSDYLVMELKRNNVEISTTSIREFLKTHVDCK